MMKRKKNIFLIIAILLVVSSFVVSISYARYTSVLSSSDLVRVAKAGDLVLVEKLNGEVQNNKLDSINEITHEIVSGGVVDKEVYIEFTETEVSTYVYLVIDNVNWTYNKELNKLSVINNKSDLLAFTLDDIWIFLDEVSNDDQFVFYTLVNVKDTNYNEKLNVMSKINVGIINVNDIEKINNSSLKFNAYSIQKGNNISALTAWGYLNL